MALVKLINHSYGLEDVIWEVGSIVEVDDSLATYQIACGRMEMAPPAAKRTEKPPPMYVAPKATPQATGEAIAKALSDTLGGKSSKHSKEDGDEEDNDKSKGKKKHEF